VSARDDQARFFGKLAALVEAGVPLLAAYETALGEVESASLRGALARILARAYRGSSLTDAFGVEAALFSPEVLLLIQTGEQTGDIDRKAAAISRGLADGVFGATGDGGGPEAGALDALVAAVRAANATSGILDTDGGAPRLRLRGPEGGREAPIAAEVSADAVLRELRAGSGPEPAERVAVRVCEPDAGPEIVVEVLPEEPGPPLSTADLARVREWLSKPGGLVLVAGLPGPARDRLLAGLLGLTDPVARPVGILGPRLPGVPPGVRVYAPGETRLGDLAHLDVLLAPEPRSAGEWEAAAGAALSGRSVVVPVTSVDLPSVLRRIEGGGVLPEILPPAIAGGVLLAPDGSAHTFFPADLKHR
jgi:hypothetical protein